MFSDPPTAYTFGTVLLTCFTNIFFGAVSKRQYIIFFIAFKFRDVPNNSKGTFSYNSKLKKDFNEHLEI